MKKKFLAGALLIVLSSAGYGQDLGLTQGKMKAILYADENFKKLEETVKKNKLDISSKASSSRVSTLESQMKNKADRSQFDKIEKEIQNKADKTQLEDLERETESLKQTVQKNDHISRENDKMLNEKLDTKTEELKGTVSALSGDIANLTENKVEKIEYNKDKENQKIIDKKQNEKIDRNERGTNILNNEVKNMKYDIKETGKLAKENKNSIKENQKNIDDLQEKKLDKEAYKSDKEKQIKKDTEQDKKISENKTAINTNKNIINKEMAERMAADEKLQSQINHYGARVEGLEKRVDNLDSKLNKGLSLMSAMNAVDFQDITEGEMALGAGVGHYGNAQSAAIGVAYAPSQNLNLNVKYSVTAGDIDSFALGAGASYKFRVK